MHASSFKGLRYGEVRGLLQSYGLNTRAIIAMSSMGQVLEMIVGGEAREQYISVLRSKKRLLIEDLDVLDGSPPQTECQPGNAD